MNRSENIIEIAKALVEFQKTDLSVFTDKENPFFGNKYADLASIWSVIRKPLTENGLSIVQTTDISDSGIVLETTLLHVSGEYISGKLKMSPEKNTPQGIGSAMKYARRYALSAIVGVCTKDDDGEGAMDREKTTDKNRGEMTKAQWEKIKTIGSKKELSEDEIVNLVQFTARKKGIAPRSSRMAALFITEELFKIQLEEYLDSLETGG